MTNILSQLDAFLNHDQVVARDAKASLTYGQLIQACHKLAVEFEKHQIKRLALCGDNSINWMIADLACQAGDVCVIPLATFFTPQQLQNVLEKTPVDAVLCEQSDIFASFFKENITAQLNTPLSTYKLLILQHRIPAAQLPDQTQKITFTSGSTGNPKGVCLSNTQLILQGQVLADIVNLDHPRHLCLLPLSTLLENVAGIYSTLLAKGEVMIPGLSEIGFEGSSSLSPEQFVATINRYSPNSIIVTPQLLLLLISAAETGWLPPATLKFVAVGGARVSPQLLARAHALNIPAYEGYGLSECASVVSLNTPLHNDRTSSGLPLPHLKIDIENGEIIVSGNAMLGYANEPESWGQTRIHTGDIGYLNTQGFLDISGRKNNLLISSYGRNINPEWVESELLIHPAIAECVVFGDARPYCIALISTRGEISLEVTQQFIDQTNAQLPDYARIQNWHLLVEPLSKQKGLVTDNGRPRREAIAQQYAELIDSLYPNQIKVQNQ